MNKDKNIEIGKRIREIRIKKGISQLELATLIGAGQSTIAGIETGARGASLKTLQKIANVLNVPLLELLGAEEKKKIEPHKRPDLLLLPVYSDVPASGFKGGDVEIIDYMPTPKSMITGIPEHSVAWVKVSGDSMSPKVNPGDMILVANGGYVRVNNGDLVVAVYEGKRTLKRFYDKGNYIVLQPENQNYEPIVIDKENLDNSGLYLYKVLWIAYKP